MALKTITAVHREIYKTVVHILAKFCFSKNFHCFLLLYLFKIEFDFDINIFSNFNKRKENFNFAKCTCYFYLSTNYEKDMFCKFLTLGLKSQVG